MKPFCPSVFLSQTACSAKFSKATNYASLNSCSSELVKPIAGRQVTDTSLQLQMTSRVLEESSHEKYTLYHASIFNLIFNDCSRWIFQQAIFDHRRVAMLHVFHLRAQLIKGWDARLGEQRPMAVSAHRPWPWLEMIP